MRYVCVLVFLLLCALLITNNCHCRDNPLYELNRSLILKVNYNSVVRVCLPQLELKGFLQQIFGEYAVNIKYTDSMGLRQSDDSSFKILFGSSADDVLSTLHAKDNQLSTGYIFPIIRPSYFKWNPEEPNVMYSSSSEASFAMPTFPSSCFAVYDFSNTFNQPCNLNMSSELTINDRLVLQAVVGAALLLTARTVATSMLFYYAAGTGAIVFSSFFLLLILCIRLLPMKRTGLLLQSVIFIFGGTVSVLFVLVEYFRSLIVQLVMSYTHLVFGYILVISSCSLIIMYWFQLPDKLIDNYPRTVVVLTFLLRVVGSFLISYSVQLPSRTIIDSLIDFLSVFVDPQFIPTIQFYLHKFSGEILVFILMILFMVSTDFILRFWDDLNPCNVSKSDPSHSYKRENRKTFVPGSPWAESSPFQYKHKDGLRNNGSFSNRLNGYMNKSNLQSSRSSPKSHSWVSRDAYYTTKKSPNTPKTSGRFYFKSELLTDDEAD